MLRRTRKTPAAGEATAMGRRTPTDSHTHMKMSLREVKATPCRCFGSSRLCVLHLDSSKVAAQDTGQGTPPFPRPEQPVGVSDCSTGLQTSPFSRRTPPTLAAPHQSPPQASLLPAQPQTATRTVQTPLCPRIVPTGPSPSLTRDRPSKRRTLRW